MAQRLGECWYAFHLAFDVLTPLRAAGSISTADGSALVRMGDTTIVCGVKAEIAEPDLDLPDQGFLGESSTRSFPRTIVGADLIACSTQSRFACDMLSKVQTRPSDRRSPSPL
jgi:hypothetical protein